MYKGGIGVEKNVEMCNKILRSSRVEGGHKWKACAPKQYKEMKKTIYICGLCLENGNKLCARCNDIYYCGKECQVKHWPEHKKTCRKKSLSMRRRR